MSSLNFGCLECSRVNGVQEMKPMEKYFVYNGVCCIINNNKTIRSLAFALCIVLHLLGLNNEWEHSNSPLFLFANNNNVSLFHIRTRMVLHRNMCFLSWSPAGAELWISSSLHCFSSQLQDMAKRTDNDISHTWTSDDLFMSLYCN